MSEYCISTTTSGFTLEVDVPVDGLLPVQDSQAYPYFAVPCSSASSTDWYDTQVLLPFVLAIVLWIVVFEFSRRITMKFSS